MPEYVRVKDPETGHEYTTSKSHAETNSLRVLKKDAVDVNGAPLPAKHNIQHGKKPAGTTTSGPRAGSEE